MIGTNTSVSGLGRRTYVCVCTSTQTVTVLDYLMHLNGTAARIQLFPAQLHDEAIGTRLSTWTIVLPILASTQTLLSVGQLYWTTVIACFTNRNFVVGTHASSNCLSRARAS